MGENNVVTISAPGKLLLLGDHAVVYGYPCLVTAVNYRVFVEVSLSEKDEFIFPDRNKSNFIDAGLTLFRKKFNTDQPVKVKTWADYTESYGLGSSSAVTVSLVKALSESFSIKLSQKELFDLCYEVVLQVQGVGSGFDIAAAIWGGTLYFVTGGKKIKPYTGFIEDLPLVVAYSGSKGNTPELVKKVAQLREEKKELVNEVFAGSEWIVNTARDFLIAKSYQSLGRYMNNNHHLLQHLGVSTPKLDALVDVARKAGAYGAKLSGAGGGDCMIALVPPEKRKDIEQALAAAGGTILTVTTNEEGVRIQ